MKMTSVVFTWIIAKKNTKRTLDSIFHLKEKTIQTSAEKEKDWSKKKTVDLQTCLLVTKMSVSFVSDGYICFNAICLGSSFLGGEFVMELFLHMSIIW